MAVYIFQPRDESDENDDKWFGNDEKMDALDDRGNDEKYEELENESNNDYERQLQYEKNMPMTDNPMMKDNTSFAKQ